MLLACVTLAALLPVHRRAAEGGHLLTSLGVAWLFFLHGAKLSRQTVLEGLLHWRLHLLVLVSTFALFPLLELALQPLLTPIPYRLRRFLESIAKSDTMRISTLAMQVRCRFDL